MSPFVDEFNLSVTVALRDQLMSKLKELDTSELDVAAMETLDRRGGVYQLFLDDALVYVGKSAHNLPSRLAQHHRKLTGRKGDLLRRISFRCVYVSEDLDALAPEKMLISSLRPQGEVEWNTNGFGNKDPGRQRDTSLVEQGHFDRIFPIDLSISVTPGVDTTASLFKTMKALKTTLPYNFRFQADKTTKAELNSLRFYSGRVGSGSSAFEWFRAVSGNLPPTWRTIALPGYVIAYPDIDVAACNSRLGHWERGESGVVDFLEHDPEFAAREVPQDEEAQ